MFRGDSSLQGITSFFRAKHGGQPRFSAYRIPDEGIRITLPGRTDAHQVFLEYQYGNTAPQRIEMHPKKHQWELPRGKVLSNKKALGYRFVIKHADGSEEILLDHTQRKNGFNVIPKNSGDPSSIGPTVLVFRDSLVTPEQLDTYTQLSSLEKDNVRSKRTHFNKIGGTEKSNDVLSSILKAGKAKMVEDRPLIGGDDISAHGYWTKSLFKTNSIISGPSGFEKLALQNLKDGARMCFDGAFVNEGLNGVHYLANLYYGHNSPFLPWFDYGKLNQFPNERLKLGILPLLKDPITQKEVPNHKAWDVRFIKPSNPHNPEAPYFVQLYDPRVEDNLGNQNPLSETAKYQFTNSQDSVQKYCFPISPTEYEAKRKALTEASQIQNPVERFKTMKQLKSVWNRFEFTTRNEDNSGYSWDGQIDVKKINIDTPEVTQYVKDACTYWTDKIDRLYTANVAGALQQKGLISGGATATQWLKRINTITTQNTKDPSQMLPSLNQGEENPISNRSIEKALQDLRKKQQEQTLPASSFLVKQLSQNFHLATLPAPQMMEILFHTPRLKQLLTDGDKPLWFELLVSLSKPVFSWIDRLFPKQKVYQRSINWLTQRMGTQKSFMHRLEQKLESSLTPRLKQKLKDPLLGHLFYEEIGRSLYLSLLTGKFISPRANDETVSPAFLSRLFAANKDLQPTLQALVNGTPNQAAKLLNRFFTQQLSTFDTAKLNAPLEALLGNLTPESAAVARHVLHKRCLGLHWRIDAMKDLGDMDGVRGEPTEEIRQERLEKIELPKIKRIMATIAHGIRSVFPRSVLKGEITDFHILAGPQKAMEYLTNLMDGNIINGIPNYNWFFSSGHKAIRMTPRPDGDFPHQLSPAQYIQNTVKPMMQILPMEQALLFQNMTSNHDMSTSLYGLTLHPYQARYDYLDWLGLNYKEGKEDVGTFHLALNELQYRQQLQTLRNKLPQGCFQKLRTLAASRRSQILRQIEKTAQANHEEFCNIEPFLNHSNERKNPLDRRPIPFEAKEKYVDALFQIISPKALGLSQTQHQQLYCASKQLLLEPSEVKAMRGKISNTFHQIQAHPEPLTTALGDQSKANKLLLELGASFDKAPWEVSQQHVQKSGQWLGYRQLDHVIGWTIDHIAQQSPKKALIQKPDIQTALKQTLYNEAIRPALEQFKRIVALQIAMPGDPSFYLADLLGQAGGEDLRNMYLGNRELIRHDWLKTNPLIQQFFEDVTALIRQRHENHVLNNGHLELPYDPDLSPQQKSALDMEPILPIIRDNGKDQALCLINFAAPEDPWTSWMKDQKTPNSDYPELVSNPEKQTVRNFFLDLRHLGIRPGTLYKAVDPESKDKAKYYVVRGDHILACKDNLNRGIDINIARTLVRVNSK